MTEIDPTVTVSPNYEKGNYRSVEISRIIDSELRILVQFYRLSRLDWADGAHEAGVTIDDEFYQGGDEWHILYRLDELQTSIFRGYA